MTIFKKHWAKITVLKLFSLFLSTFPNVTAGKFEITCVIATGWSQSISCFGWRLAECMQLSKLVELST